VWLTSCRLHGTQHEQGARGFYGRGAYFAERAAYSHGSYVYRCGEVEGRPAYQLILAQVLCGTPHDFKLVVNDDTRRLVKPPAGCHSVCAGPHTAYDCPEASRMWVVYDRSQVYPAYIVTYCT